MKIKLFQYIGEYIWIIYKIQLIHLMAIKFLAADLMKKS